MLKKVKKYLNGMISSSESFDSYFVEYLKEVQDKNIDREIKNMLRFGILQLSSIDQQIESDYRKLVNDRNAKSG
ncbi:MAG: hypothetical protein NC548_55485 [Lachnospiraceae bacterium]|nr:hypothetical protein [Lachnospiraceae bacterium]